jgi:site-specific DNA-methyltransferase (adenine-specific)
MRSEIEARFFNGDCIEGMERLPEHSVDMVLTDPPYGTTCNSWDTPLPLPEMWAELKRVVKPNGAKLFFAQCPFDKILGASNVRKLRYEYVWIKPRATGFFNAGKMPLKKTENVLVFYEKLPVFNPQFTKGKPYKHNQGKIYHSTTWNKTFYSAGRENPGTRHPTNVLDHNTVREGSLHPTQKPVSLCEYLIRAHSVPGDVVLDLCAGSGTTAIAAINAGRDWLAFEKEKNYWKIAVERIEARIAETEGSLFFEPFPDRAGTLLERSLF